MSVAENNGLFSADFFWRPETAENRPKAAENSLFSATKALFFAASLFSAASGRQK
jgi:hypothetical protein